MLIKILTFIFILIIGYAGIYDFKTRLVKPWTCIMSYILALVLAILKGATLKQILICSLWLFLFLYISALIFIKATGKEDQGVGGGDILIAPAITLFTFNKGLIPIYIGFILAFIDAHIFKRKEKNDETPMVTYFFISCLIYLLF